MPGSGQRLTICAIATPPGMGAIAIVRVSGPQAYALAERHVRASRPLRERYATYADIVDEHGRRVDRGIALFSRAPRSYTGEDTLELHVHGSPVVAREVVRALVASGARPAGPGEFTLRAFLNGKLDLHAAESVADLIAAESRSAARAALANLGGGLAREIRAQRECLARILEELAAAIDFPDEVADPPRSRVDERLAQVTERLIQLREDGEAGKVVREGITVAIVGPPNAGKSSLLNALLREERAIVSEIPGTTRDTIEETILLEGVLVRLVDTAGIRAHADRLEAAGIERTRNALASARIAVIVLDGAVPLSLEGRTLLDQTSGRDRIVFVNKRDLGNAGIAEIERLAPGVVWGTVFDERTLEAIRVAIARLGWRGSHPDLERPHLAAVREFEAANEALAALGAARAVLERGDPIDVIASELQRAFSLLGKITGDTATEELLTGIFSRFCIGK